MGVVLLLTLTSGLCLLVARRPSAASPQIWDIPGTSRTYTTIVGTLAGFSVTSSIFIANLTAARQSAAFESVMALFLIAFLVFISSAIQFATTPNLASAPSEAYVTVQGYSYVLANAAFYTGLSLSWLGLPLLLSAVGLAYMADVFTWLVLFAILGGASRISSGINIFAAVELARSVLMPAICFGAATIYRLLLAEQVDSFLPGEHEPALLAVVSFAIAAFGFSLQSVLMNTLRLESTSVRAAAAGRLIVVPYVAAVFTSASLLWYSIADAV